MRSRTLPAYSTLALAALLVATFAIIQDAGHGLRFFADEWTAIVHRQEWTVDAFLEPHGEHLILPTLLVFRGLLETVGLEPYWPYRLVETFLVTLCVGLVWVYARPRIGPWAALVPAGLVSIIGVASEVLLWPFEMVFVIPLACGLIILTLARRRERWIEVMISALLLLSLVSSSMGFPIWIASAVAILGPGDRRARAWILLAPLALYGLWWIPYHHGGFIAGNLVRTPNYVIDSVGAALRATFALPFGATQAAVALWGSLCAWALFRARSSQERWDLLVVLALGFGFWVLAGIGRADRGEAAASRYMFPGALFVTLPLIEVARHWRLPNAVWAAAGVGVLLLVTLVQIPRLHGGASWMRSYSRVLAPELAAVEVAGDALPPGLEIDPYRVTYFDAGLYLRAVDGYGSPVDAERELRSGDPVGRAMADALLVRGGMLRIGGVWSRGCAVLGGELRHVRIPAGGRVQVLLPAGSAGPIRASRFGTRPVQLSGRFGFGRWLAVQAKPDVGPGTWNVYLPHGARRLRCRGGDSTG